MARTAGSKTREFPAHSLEKALVVVRAIVDKGAGRAMDRLLVADAVGRTPSSSEFKRLLSSSRWYGLTLGTEKADEIVPTELGLKVAMPEQPADEDQGLVEACLKPELMRTIYQHFNRNKLPDAVFLKNTLEKSFDVEAEHSQELAALLVENATFSGILQEISGRKYIRIDDPVRSQSVQPTRAEEAPDDGEREATAAADFGPVHTPDVPSNDEPAKSGGQLFVAHGKNQKPLHDLKKILDSFGIAYKVAVDEAHAGRPISSKVAALMKECSAGIFIFTKDERFIRELPDGETEAVWRPSENVVYELGAAGIRWDRKIIILREEGVNFPSDFSDLGYITFKDGEISAKAMDVMKELVAFGLLRVQAG